MSSCILCRSTAEDELCLGKLISCRIFNVHENCLFLSSGLEQSGGSYAIQNFNIRDILDITDHNQTLVCCYCHEDGANIDCCHVGCRRRFHTVCGLMNYAQNQFMGTYTSYCHIHVQCYRERPSPTQNCAICFEKLILEIEVFSNTKFVLGRCCNNGWYHKECLQKYANSAGDSFKCPLCNNTRTFRLVALWGISVQHCAASWEHAEDYALTDDRQTVCTAKPCLSAYGREGNFQTLYYCIMCGSNPVHAQCTLYNSAEYTCDVCANSHNDSDNDNETDPSSPLSSSDSDSDDSDSELDDRVHSASTTPTTQAAPLLERNHQTPLTIDAIGGVDQPTDTSVSTPGSPAANGPQRELFQEPRELLRRSRRSRLLAMDEDHVAVQLQWPLQASQQEQGNPNRRNQNRFNLPLDESCIASRTRSRSRH